jgi:hypothetical protein
MAKGRAEGEFSKATVEVLAKRACFTCSNPSCRRNTLLPSGTDPRGYQFTGVAAHITAAAPGGPRHDPSLDPSARSSIENGIFLCATCARLVDDNDGADYPADTLRQWRDEHERWLHAGGTSQQQRDELRSSAVDEAAVQALREANRLRREEQMSRDRPEVILSPTQQLVGTDRRHDIHEYSLSNIGPGPAEGLRLRLALISGGKTWTCSLVEGPTTDRLGPGALVRVTFSVPVEASRDRSRHDLLICHYNDRHHRVGEPRVYHSVCDNRALPPQLYYRPEHRLDDCYLEVCEGCLNPRISPH